MGGYETLAEKGGVDAVRVVAFAYDTYTNPTKNNGVLRATLTLFVRLAQHLLLLSGWLWLTAKTVSLRFTCEAEANGQRRGYLTQVFLQPVYWSGRGNFSF